MCPMGYCFKLVIDHKYVFWKIDFFKILSRFLKIPVKTFSVTLLSVNLHYYQFSLHYAFLEFPGRHTLKQPLHMCSVKKGIFFLCGFSFSNIYDSQDRRGRGKVSL